MRFFWDDQQRDTTSRESDVPTSIRLPFHWHHRLRQSLDDCPAFLLSRHIVEAFYGATYANGHGYRGEDCQQLREGREN